jgi:site-specific recombinase XerD
MKETPVRSYAVANRELVKAFERYLIARGQSASTLRAYRDSAQRLVDSLGATSVSEVDRGTIRQLQADLCDKGLESNSIRLHTCGLRSFFKFVRLTGLTNRDPTLLLSHRKVPGRLPIVLTIDEVERLIAAAKDPFERAVPEVLYSTGVRVSEFVNLRLEDIDFAGHVIRVKKGKGGKDRVVLFGSKGAEAMRAYLEWRPSHAGFLFESPARNGCIYTRCGSWYLNYYDNRIQREIRFGSVSDIPTPELARKEVEAAASKIPGYRPAPARPYTPQAIREVLHRLAHRANLGRVHPHALRRAMACHMLQHGSNGINLRVIQDLLGHTNLSTTMLYTHLTTEDLKRVHEKYHPHEQGGDDGEKEE